MKSANLHMFLALLAGSVTLTTPSMGATVQYTLVNVSTGSNSATFSGSFDFDTSTNAVTNVNIVGTGSLLVSPEYFDNVFSSTETSIVFVGTIDPEGIELDFNTSLADATIIAGALDTLISPSNYNSLPCEFFLGGPCDSLTGAVQAGDVQASPLPAALPVFTTGLGVLGLLRWRGKKKAPPAA